MIGTGPALYPPQSFPIHPIGIDGRPNGRAERYADIPADLWLEVSRNINIMVIHRPHQIVRTEIGPEHRYRLPAYNIDDLLDVRVGKLVIYSFSPLPLNAVVRLSIIKSWSFSAVYPDVPIKSSESGQSIEWNINTREDYTMTDLETGARISYLVWEAETNAGLPPSPPSSPRLGPSYSDSIFPFDLLLAELTDNNSVVLPTSKTALYLDRTLAALGLHVEARTSFITYWLPSILKHDFVALRFLPQASYKHAAPLDIEPKPDVITRVFMLFKRVCDDELDEWAGAVSRASENVEFWKGVVGAEYDRMRDEALFRVLEWGGLEVKN
ncbi:hypothetical protein EV421DRAFT_1939495 [Armillaria borealis]|uniref:Uncharacterized protein n=1 Tax=Armillaria borealis TaxID=47425 RepID=A0AA39MDY6_9AGAR|nr:hypothetical protein EV421DRAFT_1939495 [Armillaria borealis]